MKALTTILATLALSTVVSFAADETAPAKPGAPGDKPADHAPGAPGKDRPHRDPAEIFKKLDSNSDNSISLDEMKAGPMGKKDPVKAEEAFKKMDKDSDGKVTLEEFKAGHEAGHGPKKGDKKAN